MALNRERSPREQETLIFDTPEEGQAWQEKAVENLGRGEQRGVNRQREAVGDMVAEEFQKEGENVENVREPWEHTQEEHKEAQELVDVAFARDLPAAIRKARSSENFPRNLDLFHDVLTGEMYHLVGEHKLSKQPIGMWLAVAVAVAVLIIGIAVFLLV